MPKRIEVQTRLATRSVELLWLGILVACAQPKPSPAHPTAPTAVTTTTQVEVVTESDDPRRLATNATFADLVSAARAADSADEGHGISGCLLRGPQSFRLEADLSPAARPLPEPPPQLRALLEEHAGTLSVLTTWGNLPGELSDVTLLAFTTTSTDSVKLPAIALFATPSGLLLRAAEPAIRAHPELLTRDLAMLLLTQLSAPSTLFVTADAALPLTELFSLLREIPNRLEVALAIALPRNTRLPAAAVPSQDGICPSGLPAPARTDREGQLSAASAQTALAPLRDAALSCALSSGGRALLGGRLVFALRIGADGHAREACFLEDQIGEGLLRRCLISAAHELALPTPAPAGFVDLALPLQLELKGPEAQRAVCE
jgi:hypothetical protein